MGTTSNIDISDCSPAVYFPRYLAARHVGPEELAQLRYWHALPGGWEHLPYEDFLVARRRAMAHVIRDGFAVLSGHREQSATSDPVPVEASWRIHDLPMATEPTEVAQPSDLSGPVPQSATATQTRGPTSTQQLHLEFWTQFRQYMEDRGSPIQLPKPMAQHFTNIAIGRSYFYIGAWNGMRDNRSGVDLVMGGPDSKAHFHLLRQLYGTEIDARLGPVEWRELPQGIESKVSLVRPSTPTDWATWPELNAFGQAFRDNGYQMMNDLDAFRLLHQRLPTP